MPKYTLITGGNRGLGFEIARQLGQSGAKVLVGSRTLAAGKRAAGELRSEGIDASPLILDVTSASSVKAAAAEVESELGRLDVLVNNAGILPEATEPSAEGPVNLTLFRKTFETNIFGAVAVVQEFLPPCHCSRSLTTRGSSASRRRWARCRSS